MKTVAIINLKGGVAKTTTAVSLAELLAEGDKRRKRPGSRVLLFDNDKQGNASRIFGAYEREQEAGACRIIKTGRIAGNIRDTEVENMDIVTCNYFMELAELEIKADIIDNPPDLGMNVINAMVAADEIIIPICLDAYSLDGLEELVEQINQIRALNPKTRLAGVLITDYEKSDTSEAAESWIRAKSGCPVFSQKIRHSKKAKDATFYRLTPLHYSIRSGAAQDYKAFAAEYVQKFGGPAAGERS